MRWILLCLSLLPFALHAEEDITSLRNLREGTTFYSKRLDQYVKNRAAKRLSTDEAQDLFKEALKKQDTKSLCAYSLNQDALQLLRERAIEVNFKGFLYLVRDTNEIDDVSLGILLKAHEVKSSSLYDKKEEDIIPPNNSESNLSILKLIASFEKRFAKENCFDDAYRSFYQEVLKQDKNLKSYTLESLFHKARQEKMISEETFVALEQARMNDLQNLTLNLASYAQKIRTLRIQYPLRDQKEQSNFVTGKVKKIKMSRRQKLFENYSDLQIIMMGNIIKTLRADLESTKVEILVYNGEEVRRRLELEPMERFRFAIKSLRKEMTRLSLNTYFNGRSPDYIDLMVASYEIGIIPASELEAVASLEEIWNPKKTFWDKAGIWIKTLSSVATIVIPPPYGFIPALAIVVIEATAGKKKDPNTNDPSVLF
jgi:hypothetical protein